LQAKNAVLRTLLPEEGLAPLIPKDGLAKKNAGATFGRSHFLFAEAPRAGKLDVGFCK
jgi:hypothetical protein